MKLLCAVRRVAMNISCADFQNYARNVHVFPNHCIYSAYVMHAISNLLLHGGYIYYINLYGTEDVCMCTCMWYGDAYKDRVVFLISKRFVYTYYYVD